MKMRQLCNKLPDTFCPSSGCKLQPSPANQSAAVEEQAIWESALLQQLSTLPDSSPTAQQGMEGPAIAAQLVHRARASLETLDPTDKKINSKPDKKRLKSRPRIQKDNAVTRPSQP